VPNKSAPRGVGDQSPAIPIGATIDVRGDDRRLRLGDFRASCQPLVACGNAQHRGSRVRVSHPRREASSLGGASHPLRRSRRIIHPYRVAHPTPAAKSHLSEHATTLTTTPGQPSIIPVHWTAPRSSPDIFKESDGSWFSTVCPPSLVLTRTYYAARRIEVGPAAVAIT
jgi:hypothetical protein